MNIITACGVTGLIVGLGYYFYDKSKNQDETVKLKKGNIYNIKVQVTRDDARQWSSWADVQKELAPLKNFGNFYRESENSATFTYDIEPKTDIKLTENKPMFQLSADSGAKVNFLKLIAIKEKKKK